MEIHTRENALPPLLKDNLIKLLRNAAEAGDSIRVTQLLREPSLKDVKKAEKVGKVYLSIAYTILSESRFSFSSRRVFPCTWLL
jgi:hypothetical protein